MNAGSSSVKYALFEGDSIEPFESGVVDLERESIGYGEAADRAVAAARNAAESAEPRTITEIGTGAVRVFALRAREEWMIARETRRVAATPGS
ncbi:MAG: hypothetical protein M3167_18165 [Acidobacteriota bacterium]|nr:hypothetical protein [Acidobacteriota bacterium]